MLEYAGYVDMMCLELVDNPCATIVIKDLHGLFTCHYSLLKWTGLIFDVHVALLLLCYALHITF